MKNLKQLVDFVNLNKTKHINNLLVHSSSKTVELYHAIAEDKFQSEKAAENYFFSNSAHKHANFNRLKRSLFDRLSDIILLIDFSKSPYEDFAKAQNYCAKNIAVINIWYYTVKATEYIIPLAEKVLKIASKFGFTDHALSAARICFIHYEQKGLIKRSEKYRDQVNMFSQILNAELKTEQYFFSARRKYIRSQKPPTQAQESALRAQVMEVEKYLFSYNSSKINSIGSFFLLTVNEYLNNYEFIIETTSKILKENSEHPLKYPRPVINVSFMYLTSYLSKLGRHEEAIKTAQNGLSYFSPGSPNWFSFLNYYFITQIHSSQYQGAYEIYKQLRFNPKLHRISSTMQERISVNEAYIFYLAKTGYIELQNQQDNFTLKKFFNKVQKQKNDTGGYGISILIIEIIHRLLNQKEYDTLLDKEDALKIYMKRYLKHDYTFRMACFLKMLITVIQCNFHPVRAAAHVKAKGYLKKLQSLPYAEAKQAEDIEIIPFEILWQIVLDNLKT